MTIALNATFLQHFTGYKISLTETMQNVFVNPHYIYIRLTSPLLVLFGASGEPLIALRSLELENLSSQDICADYNQYLFIGFRLMLRFIFIFIFVFIFIIVNICIYYYLLLLIIIYIYYLYLFYVYIYLYLFLCLYSCSFLYLYLKFYRLNSVLIVYLFIKILLELLS